MTIIIQKRRQVSGYAIPPGGEIIWYGVAANVPSGYTIDSACSDVFIRGCALGSASNTILGSVSHQHDNPSTGSVADHTHPVDGASTGTCSATEETYQTNNVFSAASNHVHDIPSGTSGAGGAHNHETALTALTDLYPRYAQLYWIKNTSGSDAELPLNGIIMWDDLAANVPSGLVICDGNNGTRDLRDKFVYGAGEDADVGLTGGATTHIHDNPNTISGGSHTHGISLTSGGSGGTKNVSGYSEGETVAAGSHSHNLSGTTGSDAAHTHTLSDTGAGSSLPPYLMLYFIQRVL